MKKILIILIIGLALALAAFSCKDPDPPNHSTITAFGKTITVKGDASISTANFNTARGKLQEAMTALNTISPGLQRDKYISMVNRTGFAILIKTGNASPDVDANKSMTIGVDYLLANNAEPTIAQAIDDKVYADAFAD